MTLNEYLSEHGSAKELAAKTGMAEPEISRFRNNKKKISFYRAALIEYGTGGKVKMEGLLDDQHERTVAGFIRANVS